MVVINSEQGLHARPASLVVAEAKKFKSEVAFIKEGSTYNAKSIISLMSMEVQQGDEVEVLCTGEDAVEAKRAIVLLLENL